MYRRYFAVSSSIMRRWRWRRFTPSLGSSILEGDYAFNVFASEHARLGEVYRSANIAGYDLAVVNMGGVVGTDYQRTGIIARHI